VVAAVNGHAIAGGCVLALQADYRLMAAGDFQIGLNEVQLGIGLPLVVIESLKLVVPGPSLLPIALQGRLLSPAHARELGLVEEVVPAAELVARALDKARALAAVPQSGFRQVKAALRRPALEALARGASDENERWLDSWFSDTGQRLLREAVRRLTSRRS
jgi:enoyl-CoA hydratase